MTREELKTAMTQSGELQRFQKTPNWIAAFDLYRQSTGDKEVAIGCSGCYRKVKNWIMQ